MRIALGLGSNLGDRFANLVAGIQALTSLPSLKPLKLASIYESEAIDCPEPLPFLNTAATFECACPPEALLPELLAIESRLGRTRPYPNASRPLDIDILLADDQVCTTETLTLPHPRMTQRAFVLEPLAEIEPDWRHPIHQRTLVELRQDLRNAGGPVISICRLSWPSGLFL